MRGSLFFLGAALLAITGCDFGAREFSLHRAWMSEKFVTASGMELSGNNRLIRFYENGIYTMFGGHGGYDYGRWSAAEKANYVVLHPAAGSLELLDAYWQYQPISRTQMKVVLYRNPGMISGTEEGFYMMKSFKEQTRQDPFHPNMNLWRIAPDSTESLENIRQRVLDYLQFQRTWYEFAKDQKLDILPMGWYPQPMQMHYANGVRMAYATELDDWNKCFFDSVAAVRGYQFIGGALREVKLLETDDKVERNLDCLKQMIEVIRSTDILKASPVN